MLARHAVIVRIGGIDLVGGVVGRVVDEEGVARQRRTVERKQPPARFLAVRPREKRRDRIAEPLERIANRIERRGTETETARARAAPERQLVFLHARIEGRIGAGDAEQFDKAAVGEPDVAIGDAAGVVPGPHLETQLDRHDRGYLIDPTAPQQNVVESRRGCRDGTGRCLRSTETQEHCQNEQDRAHGESLGEFSQFSRTDARGCHDLRGHGIRATGGCRTRVGRRVMFRCSSPGSAR